MIIDGVLYGSDRYVAEWVQRKLGGDPLPSDFVAVGLVVAGRIRGGVVWFNRKARDITGSVYSSDVRCAHPAIMTRVMAYPYIQLGLDRVTAEVAESNTRSIRNFERMGAVLEGIKDGAAADGSDELIFGLKRENFVFADKLRAMEIEWEAHQAHRNRSTPAPQQPPNGAAMLQHPALMS